MEKAELLQIANSRQNLIGFLDIAELRQIEEISGVNVDGLSYDDAVKALFAAKLTPKKREKAVMILVEANNQIKTEKFRYEYGSIYEYSVKHDAYLFRQHGTYAVFKKLINEYGEYL